MHTRVDITAPLGVLVIDDEKPFCDMLAAILRKEGYSVEVCRSAQDALVRLGETSFDIVLCDIQMPEMGGLDFLEAAKARGVMRTTIMMSAFASIDTALEAMRRGAYDYIGKPFNRDAIVLTLGKARERELLRKENLQLRAQLDQRSSFHRLVAKSEVMTKLFRTIEKVAAYKSTVLLSGESGTGKELVARAIHEQSPRADKAFVAVNCGAIPEALLESELFGYVAGAFTDARSDKRGLFEEAHEGTLFLDEVGELPTSMQVKLLRALQEGEIRKVGSSKSKAVDVRVIAATVRNLTEEAARGAFREDLYYRLHVLPLHLPALRERADDIALLVEHFVVTTNQRLGTQVRQVSPEAMQAMMRYKWPGNVRELENTIERAIVLCEGDVITADMLPDAVHAANSLVSRTLTGTDLSIKRTTRLIEEELIRRALEQTGGNRTAASRLLELSHRALLYKLKEYGLTDL